MKKALVTGSQGLVGSAMVELLIKEGFKVVGIDNNQRGKMFGYGGSTGRVGRELLEKYKDFSQEVIDIRDRKALELFFRNSDSFNFICHAAAQPSHEFSTNNAFEDFDINAVGTMNMLENYRQYSKEAVFIHVSTSKVYGDHVNNLPLVEYETRYDLPKDHKYYNGVNEEYDSLEGNLK